MEKEDGALLTAAKVSLAQPTVGKKDNITGMVLILTLGMIRVVNAANHELRQNMKVI